MTAPETEVVMSEGKRFDVRSFYLYAVCLVTLIIMVFSFQSMVRDVLDLVVVDNSKPEGGAGGYDEQHYRIVNLVSNVVLFVMSAGLYLYHWRKAQSERVAPRRTQDEVST